MLKKNDMVCWVKRYIWAFAIWCALLLQAALGCDILYNIENNAEVWLCDASKTIPTGCAVFWTNNYLSFCVLNVEQDILVNSTTQNNTTPFERLENTTNASVSYNESVWKNTSLFPYPPVQNSTPGINVTRTQYNYSNTTIKYTYNTSFNSYQHTTTLVPRTTTLAPSLVPTTTTPTTTTVVATTRLIPNPSPTTTTPPSSLPSTTTLTNKVQSGSSLRKGKDPPQQREEDDVGFIVAIVLLSLALIAMVMYVNKRRGGTVQVVVEPDSDLVKVSPTNAVKKKPALTRRSKSSLFGGNNERAVLPLAQKPFPTEKERNQQRIKSLAVFKASKHLLSTRRRSTVNKYENEITHENGVSAVQDGVQDGTVQEEDVLKHCEKLLTEVKQGAQISKEDTLYNFTANDIVLPPHTIPPPPYLEGGGQLPPPVNRSTKPRNVVATPSVPTYHVDLFKENFKPPEKLHVEGRPNHDAHGTASKVLGTDP
jgi:hypothetical protein